MIWEKLHALDICLSCCLSDASWVCICYSFSILYLSFFILSRYSFTDYDIFIYSYFPLIKFYAFQYQLLLNLSIHISSNSIMLSPLLQTYFPIFSSFFFDLFTKFIIKLGCLFDIHLFTFLFFCNLVFELVLTFG